MVKILEMLGGLRDIEHNTEKDSCSVYAFVCKLLL